VAAFSHLQRRSPGHIRRNVRIALGIEGLVRDSRRPPRYLTAAVPFRTEAVREAAPQLLELAVVLKTSPEPDPRGVALADRLLTDPAGPVYSKDTGDVRAAAIDARRALCEKAL
jgi:hypothetical protein